ncbi:MAG: peptidylprolyl isomerase [Elusimicrobia bacterium]|nr:peptidylprolyl isomerase [Elusimicrobiota bacterium]
MTARRFAPVLVLAVLGLGFVVFLGCSRRRDPVLARVGKLAITEAEFRRRLGEVTQEYQNYVLTLNGRRQFLDVLIREKMMLSAATDAGVLNSSEFKAQMDRLRAEEEERLAEGRDYLLMRLWLEDLRRRGTLLVSDEEVRAHYDRHPREVLVRHILLATSDEAESALRKLRGGTNFSSLAKTKSLDAETAISGGMMRPAIYGEVIPELEDVIFRGRTGETLGPVRSKFGYHILRKESERKLSFDAAEERIRKTMEKQKLDRHLQSLQSRYPVEVMDVQFN